jgi:hypothetical protein
MMLDHNTVQVLFADLQSWAEQDQHAPWPAQQPYSSPGATFVHTASALLESVVTWLRGSATSPCWA